VCGRGLRGVGPRGDDVGPHMKCEPLHHLVGIGIGGVGFGIRALTSRDDLGGGGRGEGGVKPSATGKDAGWLDGLADPLSPIETHGKPMAELGFLG